MAKLKLQFHYVTEVGDDEFLNVFVTNVDETRVMFEDYDGFVLLAIPFKMLEQITERIKAEGFK
jgi:hypothetical protein